MAKARTLSGLNSILGEPKEEKKVEKVNFETRTTLQINSEVLEKIKAISHWDRLLIKDVIHTGLSDYVEQYEKKNGKIKPIEK